MLTRLRALMIKELLNILRDPKSRTVLIVPPIIQIFVFSFAMTMEAKNIHLGVLNLDAGRAGFELVARFQNAKTFSRIMTLKGQAEIQPVLDEQRALAVLVVPVDFSRRMEGRRNRHGPIAAGRPQDQHGPDRPGLCPAHSGRVPGRPEPGRRTPAGRPADTPLVQPQS
jgi:ABC-type Na+ efflux pump permease subunit